MPAPAPALRVGQLGEPLLLTRLLGMEGPRVMALQAPDEENGAKEMGPSLHFPALWVPPGWAGCHWPLALVITGSQQWFWHVCAVQRHQNQAEQPQNAPPGRNAGKGEHPPGTARCLELPAVLPPKRLQLFGYTAMAGSQRLGFRRAGLEWHLPSRQRVAAPTP